MAMHKAFMAETIGDYAKENGKEYEVGVGENSFTLWRIKPGNGDERIEMWIDSDSCIGALPTDFPGYALFHLYRAFKTGYGWGRINGRTEVQSEMKKALGL